MRWAIMTVVLVQSTIVAAENRSFATNVLAGPVLGVSWGHRHKRGLLLGVEGGGGFGPERANLGFTFGPDRYLGYVELDPWYGLGFSLGFGIDSEAEVQPVFGAWEGAPLTGVCNSEQFHLVSTISVGFRYTGAYELYLAPKIGGSDNFCSD